MHAPPTSQGDHPAATTGTTQDKHNICCLQSAGSTAGSCPWQHSAAQRSAAQHKRTLVVAACMPPPRLAVNLPLDLRVILVACTQQKTVK